MIDFKLSNVFVDAYKDKTVSWGPLGEFVYYRTYSRFLFKENRNEVWHETIRRVVEGCFTIQKRYVNELKLPWKQHKAQKSAQTMFDKIFNFKFLPPGRGLWLMGTKFVDKNGSAGLNNCGFVSTHDIDIRGAFPFAWTMDNLMLGVGVGFDTRGAGKVTVKAPKMNDNDYVYQIEDSREGWVDSVRLILEGFFEGKKIPEFDYSLVRKAGEPIRGFGGIASGPGPLKVLHENIREHLLERVGKVLASTDIVDLMNYIACCVVSGNVRRSAEIAIGDLDDQDYVRMKSDLDKLRNHRWSSNNSVFVEVGKSDYNKILETIKLNGEPGLVWLDNIRKYSRLKDPPDYKDRLASGVNPCSEQTLESSELCCLVENFPSLHDTYEEFQETLKYAYLYAKTVTLLPTNWEETNAVLLKNRRIGTSQSGIIDGFKKHGRRELLQWSDDGYNYLTDLDQIYSDWLCVPKSIKKTTVKPSGTVSLLPGVSPGIHYPHSEFYIRRVRIPSNSPLLKIMEEAGYHTELSKYGSDGKTMVVSIPVHEPYFWRSKNDATMWEQVKNAVDYQRFWSDNNVSITVTFKKEEGDQIPYLLECYEDVLKSISFLPIDVGVYEQMPYEEITRDRFMELQSKIKKPDFSVLSENPDGERFCDSDKCEL